jgi:Transglycosylase SLT domain
MARERPPLADGDEPDGGDAPRRLLAAAALAGGSLTAKLAALAAGLCLACLLALLCFLALFGALLGGPARGASVSCGLSSSAGAHVPAELVPIYERASARYRLGERGVPVLAAINKIESGFGRNLGPSSAGAYGWMQFMPATWQAYGVDADGDRAKDPADPDDAIHGAARYLSASGAPGNWYRALFAYNHADWYVQQVLAQADAYQGACTLTLDSGPVELADLDFRDTSGDWDGSRKFALALAELGRPYGCLSTSEKRERKYTDSGGISDHWIGSLDAYAVDIDSAACTMHYPGGEADRTAEAIAAALGMPTHTGVVEVVRGAYRFQLLWQTDGHYDHVHIGVKLIGGPP